jgi:hypothetical protein
MTFFAENFLDMLVDTVTVAPMTGRSDDGQATYGAPKSYQARINYETHNVLGKENQLVVARGVIWMACIDPINVDDRITFPDGTQPVILMVSAGSDENGPAYTKLDFQ